jgi:hypothetical protein
MVAFGVGFTVILLTAELLQPFASVKVYVMFTDPAKTPVTTPLLFTVAILVLDELQVPPEVVFVKFIVAPSQTFVGPEIGASVGSGFTEIVVFAE